MRRGEIYEFHSHVTGEIRTYELESAGEGAGANARLRNLANDKVTSVLVHSLRRPENWPSKSYWKRVEE